MPISVERTNLVIPRGEVFFDRFVEGASSGGELYLGNTTEFRINRTVRRLATKGSWGGMVHEQKGHLLSEEVGINITTDNIDFDNVANWFGRRALPATEGDDIDPIIEETAVRKGMFYQLGKSVNPMGLTHVTGIRLIFNGTDLERNVDFELDAEAGRVYILPDSPLLENYPQPTVVIMFWKYLGNTTVINDEPADVIGTLRFIGRKGYGATTDYFFPLVRLAPVGVFDMKGDEFQQIRFEATAVRQGTEPLIYIRRDSDTRPVSVTADTTLITADTTAFTADVQ